MTETKPIFEFSDFLRQHFPCKVQKISINAGFTCPNRDGACGTGGCSYCNNQTFNPDYCKPTINISEQLVKGKEFFARKYPEMKYLAYFQAYTNTYAEISVLKSFYEEALASPNVVGIIIGTRPDCMPDELLEYLKELNRQTFVLVEYGAETANNSTLSLINRGHTWQQTEDAVLRTAEQGILCGLHLILGLPGETVTDYLNTIRASSALPISTLKIHQLQIIKRTRLAYQVEKGILSVPKWTAEQYIDLCCRLIPFIRKDIALERFVSQSPAELLISPKWGLKNYEFTNLLNARIRRNNIRQGSKFDL